jgi:hypothetical protein
LVFNQFVTHRSQVLAKISVNLKKKTMFHVRYIGAAVVDVVASSFEQEGSLQPCPKTWFVEADNNTATTIIALTSSVSNFILQA